MKKLNLGILYSPQSDLNRLINRLNQVVSRVQLIMPDQRTKSIDCLILPDTKGVSPGLKGLVRGGKVQFSLEPICPYMEAFRYYGLEFYKEDTPIIGIGSSANMLYSEVLGKELAIVGEKVYNIPNTTVEYYTLDSVGFIENFYEKSIYGCSTAYDGMLTKFISIISDQLEIIKDPPPEEEETVW